MKRRADVGISMCDCPPSKKQKFDKNSMDDIKCKSMDDIKGKSMDDIECKSEFMDIDQKSEFPLSMNASKMNKNDKKISVFCSIELRDDLLSSLNEERKKKLIGDIVIYEPENYGNSEIVSARSLCTRYILQIKDTLKKIGFTYDARHFEWTMNKQYFIADYDLYIGEMLKQICQTNKFTLSVFDFNYTKKKQNILTDAVNVFIYYDPQLNEIYIETNIDEEKMIHILDKRGYKLSGYGSNGMNIYHKKGILYNGHIETWKECVVFNQWILGFISDNIVSTPHCIDCNTGLTLHKVKKKGDNEGRRFYNCDQCYYHTQNTNKRKYSFIWADGDMKKPSELVISQQLTQPFSQIII